MKSLHDQRSVSLGYRTARIYRTTALLLDKQVNRLGLCTGQVPYIIALAEREGQTQDELSAYLRVNRAATARTLKTMEGVGLVTRMVNQENQRQKLVYLTDTSRALLDDLFDILSKHNTKILADFSTQEKTQLFSLLDRVIENIEHILAEHEDTNAFA